MLQDDSHSGKEDIPSTEISPIAEDAKTKEKGGHEGASSMRPRAVRAIGVKVRVLAFYIIR